MGFKVMEEGGDFIDIARSLIQPSRTYSPWQSTTSWFPTESNIPRNVAASPQANGANMTSNGINFGLNHAQNGLATATGNSRAQGVSSPAPVVDRAAQLRAQLLASRKMTPDSTKSNDAFAPPAHKTSQAPSGAQIDESVARSNAAQHALSNDDVDALIASAVKPVQEAYHSSGKSRQNGEVTSSERTHNGTPDRRSSQIAKGVPGPATNANVDRPGSSHQWKGKHLEDYFGTDEHGTQYICMPDDPAEVEWLAAERVRALERRYRGHTDADSKGARSTATNNGAARTQADESTRKDQSNNGGQDEGLDNGTSIQHQADKMPSTQRAVLTGLDFKTLPVEIEQWLEISGFHDEEYRSRELGRCNKILDLQRQMEALQQQALEDRTRITRGPSMLAAVPAATMATSTPSKPTTSAPEQPQKAQPVAPSSPPKATAAPKRPREEDTQAPEPQAKAIKSEGRSLESRITSDIPDRARAAPPRHSPPPRPASRNGYESYHPHPRDERDRYDSYHGRGFYDDREREREREMRERDRERVIREREERERERDRIEYEERERYGHLAFEDAEENEERKKNKGKKVWDGVPCVPCRYFKAGNCHRGAACTFLHE